MKRAVGLVGLAIAVQALAVWWNAKFPGSSTLTDPAEPFGTALTITAMTVIAGVLAWRSLLPTPAHPVVGLAFIGIGVFMTFAWPVSFALATSWTDLVSDWGRGAALPQWQGAMTATVGAGVLLRSLLGRSGSGK